jgi:hypothetical protein
MVIFQAIFPTKWSWEYFPHFWQLLSEGDSVCWPSGLFQGCLFWLNCHDFEEHYLDFPLFPDCSFNIGINLAQMGDDSSILNSSIRHDCSGLLWWHRTPTFSLTRPSGEYIHKSKFWYLFSILCSYIFRYDVGLTPWYINKTISLFITIKIFEISHFLTVNV